MDKVVNRLGPHETKGVIPDWKIDDYVRLAGFPWFRLNVGPPERRTLEQKDPTKSCKIDFHTAKSVPPKGT